MYFTVSIVICYALLHAKICIPFCLIFHRLQLKLFHIMNVFDYCVIFDLHSECPWARPQVVMTKFTGDAERGELLQILPCARGSLREYLYCDESNVPSSHSDFSFNVDHSNLVTPRL